MWLLDYKIPKFQDIEIFCTDRKWWNSTGNYKWLNLWIKSWDDEKIILTNRESLAQKIWKSIDDFIYLNQVHSWDVCVLKKWDRYNGEGYDALFTNDVKNIPIILVADCVPIVVYDSVKKISGVIHSGWKGTAKNILENTLLAMQSSFDSQLPDIHVIVWPCISAKSYEVDDRVIQHFSDDFYTQNNKWWYQLNLRWIIEAQTKNAWVLRENIYHINICTLQRKDLFFSARRDWYESGRFAMGIYFK